MKSLGVYYWYVKMERRGCVELGLEYITFYVKKHIWRLFWTPAGSQRAARGTRICETRLFPNHQGFRNNKWLTYGNMIDDCTWCYKDICDRNFERISAHLLASKVVEIITLNMPWS